ncbi:MBL fold metallo-hydrolase [Paenibacillus solisilvae]|uniref:MBL fold metallo-hydrolase n=1 Tax=Paenibacillus solisilvae TaxID=2486751 RepID=A0ABW0W0P8_9BACL
MKIQKLPWAGIRVEVEQTSIVIDPLFHFPAKYGEPHERFYPLDEFGSVDAVLITHHHGDHFDQAAISTYYGADIPVYMPQESIALAAAHELKSVQGVTVGQSIEIGSLTASATFSVDGFGDPQVAWVVEGGGKKLIHCGDTLWHGSWWRIEKAYGPFDAACLPVNGAVLEPPGVTPSGQPIVLNPEQAVSAAVVLKASVLVPIHYKAIHYPPLYTETPNVLERLEQSANGKVKLAVLKAKEFLAL